MYICNRGEKAPLKKNAAQVMALRFRLVILASLAAAASTATMAKASWAAALPCADPDGAQCKSSDEQVWTIWGWKKRFPHW